MKRYFYTTFFLSFLSAFAFGQIEVNPSEILLSANGETELFQEFTITNSSASTGLYWTLELAADYPSDWESRICDLNLCYDWGEYTSTTAAPNPIAEGQTITFDIKTRKLDKTAMSGLTFVVIRFFDDEGMTNEVGASAFPTTSTSSISSEELVLYPNPTTNSFQIKNDNNIKTVSIFNVVGAQISSERHSTGMTHNVSDLRSGMYLVRLQDNNGKTVKSMRLSKK